MSEWKTYKLEDAIEKLIDYRGKTPSKTQSGIPLVTAKVIKNGRIEKPNEFIAEEDYESWMRRGIPKYGDVVLTTEAPLGEVAQILTNEKIALAQRVITLRGKTGLIDNSFLKYFLVSPVGQNNLKAKETGSTVTGIKQSELRKVEILAPDLPTQKEIAQILTTLDDKIELNLQMNQTLEGMAQAIFKEWFVNFNFPGFDGELVDGLPKGWRKGSVLEIASLSSGGTPKTSEPDFWDGEINWISAKDITSSNNQFIIETEKTITELGIKKSAAKLLPPFTTIISARGTVGNFCILPKEMAISQSNYGLKSNLDYDFFLFLLVKNMLSMMKAFSYGAVFDTITTKTFEAMEITIPENQVIEEFENFIKPIYNKILTNQLQIQSLTHSRDTLLPKLMSGKIHVAL
jgi:type I restriction enzyme, S subunit